MYFVSFNIGFDKIKSKQKLRQKDKKKKTAKKFESVEEKKNARIACCVFYCDEFVKWAYEWRNAKKETDEARNKFIFVIFIVAFFRLLI